jgi:hypothetical protein
MPGRFTCVRVEVKLTLCTRRSSTVHSGSIYPNQACPISVGSAVPVVKGTVSRDEYFLKF